MEVRNTSSLQPKVSSLKPERAEGFIAEKLPKFHFYQAVGTQRAMVGLYRSNVLI